MECATAAIGPIAAAMAESAACGRRAAARAANAGDASAAAGLGCGAHVAAHAAAAAVRPGAAVVTQAGARLRRAARACAFPAGAADERRKTSPAARDDSAAPIRGGPALDALVGTGDLGARRRGVGLVPNRARRVEEH